MPNPHMEHWKKTHSAWKSEMPFSKLETFTTEVTWTLKAVACFSNTFLLFQVTQAFNKHSLNAPCTLYMGQHAFLKGQVRNTLDLADQEIEINTII